MVKRFEEWKKEVTAKGTYMGFSVSTLSSEQLRVLYDRFYVVRFQAGQKAWKGHRGEWFKGEEDYISRLEKEGVLSFLGKKVGLIYWRRRRRGNLFAPK
jgi:hypothetical protein